MTWMGIPPILEKYELANNEANFWKMTVRSPETDEVHGPRLDEYLKRVMFTPLRWPPRRM